MALLNSESHSYGRSSWTRAVFLCTTLLTLGACERATTTTAEPINLAAVLPATAPYITGTIGSVNAMPGFRLLVERTPGMIESGALVGTPSNLPVYWRNGRRASNQELQVGRVITVWVSGAELRSLPPQVSASAIVIER